MSQKYFHSCAWCYIPSVSQALTSLPGPWHLFNTVLFIYWIQAFCWENLLIFLVPIKVTCFVVAFICICVEETLRWRHNPELKINSRYFLMLWTIRHASLIYIEASRGSQRQTRGWNVDQNAHFISNHTAWKAAPAASLHHTDVTCFLYCQAGVWQVRWFVSAKLRFKRWVIKMGAMMRSISLQIDVLQRYLPIAACFSLTFLLCRWHLPFSPWADPVGSSLSSSGAAQSLFPPACPAETPLFTRDPLQMLFLLTDPVGTFFPSVDKAGYWFPSADPVKTLFSLTVGAVADPGEIALLSHPSEISFPSAITLVWPKTDSGLVFHQ